MQRNKGKCAAVYGEKQKNMADLIVSNQTWVIVVWSLKNSRSATRTSKLALALSRFFCRRAVACNRNSYCSYVG